MRSVVRPLALAVPLLAVLAACGDDDDAGVTPAPAPDAGPAVCNDAPATQQKPPASCDVTITLPPVATDNVHVPEGTALTYCTDPPTSGRHYPVWAAFREYTTEIPWPYLVHDLEHGAIVLLYRCDAGGCPDIVEGLRTVVAEASADPLCVTGTKRFIIAPSTQIPATVTAVAWGASYTAPCLDLPSLKAFAAEHYAKGPENLCAPGRSF